MALGTVDVGDTLRINAANRCNGSVGVALAGNHTGFGSTVALPAICGFYVLGFLVPLHKCPWSERNKVNYHFPADVVWALKNRGWSGGLTHLHTYMIDAMVLERRSPLTNATPMTTSGPGSSAPSYTDDPELQEIFQREREEAARQLEAANRSRDAIFRAMVALEDG